VNINFLAILTAAYGSITIYFCWRYYLRRRLPSLVCAFMPLGWVVAFGLQIEEIDHSWLPALFVISMLVVAISLYIIVSHEMSRERPFR
jgi:FtsH-binding integral membrane protein